MSAAGAAIQGRASITQPQPTRRQLLKAAGLGGIAVGVGGLGTLSWRATSQGVFETGQGPAYSAWGDWDRGSGPLLLVRAAILSANAHNTQPWRWRISSSAVDLFVDPERNTGAMDRYRREQYVGLGCALENLLIAGQAKGYVPRMSLLPASGDPNLIAHIDLGRGDPAALRLYQAIPHRHTHRARFDTSRSVSAETLATLDHDVADIPDARVVWITSAAGKSQMGTLIVDATQAFIADRQQSIDSFKWWRDNWSDIQRLKDGMTLDTAGLSPLMAAIGKIIPPYTREQNDQGFLQQVRDNSVKTAAAFGVVVVRDASQAGQRINGGRLYQRLHLSAVDRDLAMQPLNTPTERIDAEQATGSKPYFADALASVLAEPGWQPLMSFRIGYPTVTPNRSPRRSAGAVLI
jgi:hypothetical protein